MTKMVKILAVALLAIMLCVSVANAAMTFKKAQDTSTVTATAGDNTGAAESINKMIGAILTVTQVIGVGVAVIMLIVLAIKYISAAPGDKADIKKHAVVYVVGAVVLFAASGILEIIKKFADNVQATE